MRVYGWAWAACVGVLACSSADPTSDAATDDAAVIDQPAVDVGSGDEFTPADVPVDRNLVDRAAPDVSAFDVSALDVIAPDVSAPDVPVADAPDVPVADAPDVPVVDAPDVPTVMTCASDGACGAGRYCAADGSCRPALCTANAAECVDATHGRTCDARGTAWADTPCSAGQVCAAGRCVARTCEPNAADCADLRTRRVCNADGLGYASTPCAAGAVCSAGACVAPSCTPGSAACADGTTRRVCNAGGTGYDAVACAAGQGCVGGACRAFVCTPGTATCASATARLVCDPNGQASTATPCAAMQGCRAGACASWTCTPGSGTCTSATQRSVCDADGLGTTTVACAAGASCAGGVCATPADACPGVEIPLDAPGVAFPLAGVRTTLDVGVTCSTAAEGSDWVGHFTLTQARDVRITATGPAGQIFAEIRRGACGATAPTERCTFSSSGTVVIQDRALDPGDYYVVVKSLGSDLMSATGSLTATTSPVTARLVGDSCAVPAELTPDGAAVTVNPAGFDLASDVVPSCAPGIDSVWHFRLNATRDVRVDGRGCAGSYQLITGCGRASTRVGACASDNPHHQWYRSLPAGDYAVVASPPDRTTSCTVSVATTAPGFRPPGDTCANAIELTPDGPAVSATLDARYDLSAQVAQCQYQLRPPNIDAIWHFRLTTTRDVTITPAGLDNNSPATAELRTACDAAALRVDSCHRGAWTVRSLPPGDYYVAVGQSSTESAATVSLRVTTAAPGLRAPGDTCDTAIAVAPDGAPGAVQMETTSRDGDLVSCEPSTSTAAPDAFFSYTLTAPRDVRVAVRAGTGNVYFELTDRCAAHRLDTARCRLTQNSTGSFILERQAPGTYYVAVGSASTVGTVTVTVTTAAPGTLNTYNGVVVPGDPPAVSCETSYLPRGTPASTTVYLPFPFRFYGRDLPENAHVLLTAFGYVVMDPAAGSTFTTSPVLGSTDQPNGLIAAGVGNRTLDARGVCSDVTGVAPNRRWALRWIGTCTGFCVPTYPEIVLYEGSNVIELYSYGTAGVESYDGVEAAVPPPGSVPGYLRFTPLP